MNEQIAELLVKNCESCEHWLSPGKCERNPSFENPRTDEYEHFHGRCLAALEFERYGPDHEDENLKQSAMLAVDGSGYFAGHFTLPSHSCSEWREKSRHLPA